MKLKITTFLTCLYSIIFAQVPDSVLEKLPIYGFHTKEALEVHPISDFPDGLPFNDILKAKDPNSVYRIRLMSTDTIKSLMKYKNLQELIIEGRSFNEEYDSRDSVYIIPKPPIPNNITSIKNNISEWRIGDKFNASDYPKLTKIYTWNIDESIEKFTTLERIDCYNFGNIDFTKLPKLKEFYSYGRFPKAPQLKSFSGFYNDVSFESNYITKFTNLETLDILIGKYDIISSEFYANLSKLSILKRIYVRKFDEDAKFDLSLMKNTQSKNLSITIYKSPQDQIGETTIFNKK